MLERFGLIGKTVPPNGLLMRFQESVRPTLPSFSVAPTTATEVGLKKASRGLRAAPRTSLARSVRPVGRFTAAMLSGPVYVARGSPVPGADRSGT